MDNLFGKDDSGNDSDPVDNDDKYEQFDSFEDKPSLIKKDFHEGMDADASPQPIKAEPVSATVASPSEPSKIIGESLVKTETIIDIVKHEIDKDGKNNREDRTFDNAVAQSYSNPANLKERRESKEKTKRELEEEEREKMQVLVSNFTEDQLDRYEMYRRAAFPKAAIKRIMQTITGCSVSQNVVIAMSGIAKVFVGEIVEEALDVMEANDESGPLQPKHLREAVRRLRLQGQIPNGRAHKAFFRL